MAVQYTNTAANTASITFNADAWKVVAVHGENEMHPHDQIVSTASAVDPKPAANTTPDIVAGVGLYAQYAVRIVCDADCSHGPYSERDGRLRVFTSKQARDHYCDSLATHKYVKLMRYVELPDWREE